MMKRPEPADIERVEGLLSRLPPLVLSPTQVARIRTGIDDREHDRRSIRSFAIAVVALAIGTAAAMYFSRPDDDAEQAPVIQPPEDRDLDLSPVPARVTVNELTPPAPPPLVVSEIPSPSPTLATPAPIAPAPAVVEPGEGSLGIESRLIGTALRQLRQQHDPRASLATLAAYERRYPNGVLVQEARAIRIEALVASGDKRAALALLDARPVKPELAVTRGELRLEVGRIEDAARDFEAALIGTSDEVEQRALFGRAACRVRLGDTAGAKQDLEQYLRRFPRGRSAPAAAKVLERIR